MTILTLNKKELEKNIGKKIDGDVENAITMMGTPVEEITPEEISIEVFPNRPDLLNMQNFARALRQYLGSEKVASFKINRADKKDNYKVKIERSVKSVRPHTVCAIVKGLKFDDEKIKEIVDIQEKLHLSIGRKRKKVAIGIYPLEEIKLPIRFVGLAPSEIKFVPLESPGGRELTGSQILRSHPTGRDYADLLKDAEVYPVFLDANNDVLSMPPIINSEKTGRITEKTKDVFIECSGFNLEYLKKCLNIIVSALDEMGGKIYEMHIEDSQDGDFVSPNLDPEKMIFEVSKINKTLGLDLNEKEIKGYLEKMGVGFDKEKDKKSENSKTYAMIPAYRTDILHWIDIAEEVALGYGYDNFEPVSPQELSVSTVAEEDTASRKRKAISEILVGCGLLECSSFHLVKKQDLKKIYYDIKNEDLIEVENSKTEYSILRRDLLVNLMKILSENSDSSYPQRIFEIGSVFGKATENDGEETGIKEKEKLGIALADDKITFTELKQIVDYLFKMIDKEYEIDSDVEENEHVGFIDGRYGRVVVKVEGKKEAIGFIGEVHPRVLKNFGLKTPVVAFEIDLDWFLD